MPGNPTPTQSVVRCVCSSCENQIGNDQCLAEHPEQWVLYHLDIFGGWAYFEGGSSGLQ